MRIEVIGMTRDEWPEAPESVTFHGFLHKDNPAENRCYYELMRGARMLVNPTPTWGAYSSTVEAMYFYNPIVVSHYEQFVKEFGHTLDFGYYCMPEHLDSLVKAIDEIINASNEQYAAMCRNAHKRVASYTWSNYVSSMLKLMEDTKNME